MEFLELMEFLTVLVPHCIHCAFTLCIQLLLSRTNLVSTQGPCPQHLPSVYTSLLIFLCSPVLLFFLTSSNQYLLHVSRSLTFWFLNEWEHMVVVFCVWLVSLNKVTPSSIHNTLWLSSIPLYKHTAFSLTFHPAKGKASGSDSIFQLLWTVLAKSFRHNSWEPDRLRPNGKYCYHRKINRVLFSDSFWKEKERNWEISKKNFKMFLSIGMCKVISKFSWFISQLMKASTNVTE